MSDPGEKGPMAATERLLCVRCRRELPSIRMPDGSLGVNTGLCLCFLKATLFEAIETSLFFYAMKARRAVFKVLPGGRSPEEP